MDADNEFHIAVHEAGHAVLGRILGMTCGPVTIEADKDSAGHSITASANKMFGTWAGTWGSLIQFRMMTFQAGALAEIELCGKCLGGDGDDRRQVTYMAEDHGDAFPGYKEVSYDDWPEWRDHKIGLLRRRARRLVKKHRALIEHVARTLIERRMLSSPEVDDLISAWQSSKAGQARRDAPAACR
jgi:ATP-dependent Zn protease